MSAADLLTVARVLAVVPIAWLVGTGQDTAAFVLFVLAAATDGLDGALARRAGATRYGAVIDPLADKALVVGTAVALFFAGPDRDGFMPPALLGLITARELAVAVIRVGEHRAGVVRPADAGGKLKTAAQMCALAVLIVVRPPHPLGVAALLLLWLGTILGLVAFGTMRPRRARPPL